MVSQGSTARGCCQSRRWYRGTAGRRGTGVGKQAGTLGATPGLAFILIKAPGDFSQPHSWGSPEHVSHLFSKVKGKSRTQVFFSLSPKSTHIKPNRYRARRELKSLAPKRHCLGNVAVTSAQSTYQDVRLSSQLHGLLCCPQHTAVPHSANRQTTHEPLSLTMLGLPPVPLSAPDTRGYQLRREGRWRPQLAGP